MNNSKKVGILLYPRFSEYELSVLLSVIKQGGKQPIYIGLNHEVVIGEAGLPCVPETTIREVDVQTLDGVVLPGVDDFEHLVDHNVLSDFLRKIDNQKRIIAAISSAPYLLSMSGILGDKKYTTGLTREQREFLGTFDGTNYVDLPVVVDDYIVTARGSAFIDFAFKFGDLLHLQYNKAWYELKS
ncbi:DJ-1/PfpI family protein [Pseudalkalibacillus sp. Hm43]|uniref:DJ-1/PfpI family protein n=1 Tax=Pseudalkalibacillus sp. Hm43 TaxID=3450742 RepID=UPI003F434409